MADTSGAPTLLASEFMQQLSANIKSGTTSTADGLLAFLRLARIYFPQSRLSVLRRELLGYSANDAVVFEERLPRYFEAEEWKNLSELAPKHRLVKTFEIPVLVLFRQTATVDRPSVKKATRFCTLSAAEIDGLLLSAEAAGAPYVVIDFNDNSNTAQLCSVTEVQNLIDNTRSYVARSIETLVEELRNARPSTAFPTNQMSFDTWTS